MSPGPYTLQDVLGVIVHAQDKHPCCSSSAAETGGNLKAGQVRHRNVQHNNVRLQFRRQGDRLRTAPRLTDDLYIRLTLENVTDTSADDHVVVRHQYPNGLGRHEPRDVAGT